MSFSKRLGDAARILGGQRYTLLDPESCGILFHPDRIEAMGVQTDSGAWANPSTIGNVTIAAALMAILRRHQEPITLIQAVEIAGADLGMDPRLVDQIKAEILGPEVQEPDLGQPVAANDRGQG